MGCYLKFKLYTYTNIKKISTVLICSKNKIMGFFFFFLMNFLSKYTSSFN